MKTRLAGLLVAGAIGLMVSGCAGTQDEPITDQPPAAESGPASPVTHDESTSTPDASATPAESAPAPQARPAESVPATSASPDESTSPDAPSDEAIGDDPVADDVVWGSDAITLTRIGEYVSGAGFDEGGAEIAAYDPAKARLFSTNGETKQIDIIDLSDPTRPITIGAIDPLSDQPGAKGANSVACADGVLVAAVEHEEDGENGFAMFYTTDGAFIRSVEIGVLPDMATFSNDGRYALIALEAKPYVVDGEIRDPEGGVAIIDTHEETIDIVSFRSATWVNGESIRAPLAEHLGEPRHHDFEPEYIAVREDGRKAYVGLQENNAIAVVNIQSASILGVYGLGFKDHSIEGNGLDADKSDDSAVIATAPLMGVYMPDSIAAYIAGDGRTYVITANEGDAREIEDDEMIYTDIGEVDDLSPNDLAEGYEVDLTAYPGKEFLLDLGKNDDGLYEQLYVGGGRSFSILDADRGLRRVYDSGDEFERYIATTYPDVFNCADDNLQIDDRSDDGGPDPEGATVGTVGDRVYAFIGLEKFGGVMVYDVTVPADAFFVTYVTGRNLSAEVDRDKEYHDLSYANTGDIGPEGLLFIPAEDSPTGFPLLTVSNEVSGTIEVYEIR